MRKAKEKIELVLLSGNSSTLWRDLERTPARRWKILRTDVEEPRDERAEHWRLRFGEGPEGLLLWLHLTGWTFDPRLPGPEKHQPFLLWPVQVEAARALWRAIAEGSDVLIDKSRDMGATWLCLAVFLWWWLFVEDTPLLLASRKEEYVDGRGNPDTLFWKLDYLLDHQPRWLRPQTERRHMHLANLQNGSVLSGESTNADLGRGGRRKAILLDEFAAVENGLEILAATADATPCRVFNSTPKGRANAFAEVRFGGKVKVLTLHWKDHPAKGRGLRGLEEAATGKHRWTSPWYESECARRTSRKEIAQELDIDYLASGETFFDLDVLQRLRAGGQLRPPLAGGELRFQVSTVEEGASYRLGGVEWRPEEGRRRLRLWCPLVAEEPARAGAGPSTGLGTGPAGGPERVGRLRPRQDRNYVAFADIAHGTGASNSVIKVADAGSREEVATFVCPDTPPHELARQAVAICQWFGGERRCLLGWEANGPGGIFGLEVCRLGYRVVLGNPDLGAPWRLQDGGVGWQSSRERKLDLLGDLRRALAREELVLHDEPTVAELEQYIYYPSGAVGPSALVQEAEGARAAHGDRVIAAAGLLLCLAQQPAPGARGGAPPPGSFAQRREARRRAAGDGARWAE